ncbi:hypothetical protein [Paenibacillus periandrae]|uniref:hypothetical protein n=1 Tax=Paenibacillus periandrae TaxID=1761741 RepID=UPI001F09AA81|nr:hypothetical protein [Paenibacillus periandrae]
MNNPEDIVEVYQSLLKYFDRKGYIVATPDGKIQCIELSNAPMNHVRIQFTAKVEGANEIERGKFEVYGILQFELGKTVETDPKFADQIMNDMQYFMEHFEGTRE